MIRLLPLYLAANETREINITGGYLEIKNAFYAVSIELLDRSGGIVSLLDDAQQSDFVRPGNFETMRVTNGPNAQKVVFYYGSGDAGSRRISGQVEVIDGNKARTLANLAFIASRDCPAMVGNYSAVQVFNVAGSNSNLVLSKMVVAVDTGGMFFGFRTTGFTGGIPARSKLSSGLPSTKATARINQDPVQQVTAQLGSISMGAGGVSIVVPFGEPIVVAPGAGFLVQSWIPNCGISAVFEFTEDPI